MKENKMDMPPIYNYKKIRTREINGYTVTSRTLLLSEEEEQKKLSEIKELLTRLSIKYLKRKV